LKQEIALVNLVHRALQGIVFELCIDNYLERTVFEKNKENALFPRKWSNQKTNGIDTTFPTMK
jgi:hypothetical protein